MHFVGTITEQVNVVSVDDVTLHVEVSDRLSATGIGLTTGVSYRVHAVGGVSFNTPTATAAQATFTERDHNNFHSDTPGLSFKGALLTHVVVLPEWRGQSHQAIQHGGGWRVPGVTDRQGRWDVGSPSATANSMLWLYSASWHKAIERRMAPERGPSRVDRQPRSRDHVLSA